jgi:hypothetical protein
VSLSSSPTPTGSFKESLKETKIWCRNSMEPSTTTPLK